MIYLIFIPNMNFIINVTPIFVIKKKIQRDIDLIMIGGLQVDGMLMEEKVIKK